MKVKRQKHVRKVMTFYRNNYGFSAPYTVLIDGTFCKAALSFKINIREQMSKYLDAEVNLCTTTCVRAECQSFGPLLYGPLKVLEQFKLYPCKHAEPVPAFRCVQQMIGKKNKNKLLLATQDQSLTETMKKTAGLPLLYIAYNAITLEAPSDKSKDIAEKNLDNRINTSEHAHLKTVKITNIWRRIQNSAVDKKQKRKRRRKHKLAPHLHGHLTEMVSDNKK
ncbi:LOW QUALITY PROTEIN: hypothetical protein KUTeg_016854 [Tegillarca granosa]|uniref:rRNA-processing protein UTP23 homolog n=1 Tax=Tegillarca granosa TaxID=220873 RepID=A0ABQ9EM61_TEGGR|nr:LOW QUALITY PROTEIN: hypothetical protein KUTeg_016854 [Tegillarca granosa]